MPNLLIMAAGTGGHVIPGLAVAREMQARGWQVSWLGTLLGMENRLVPPSGLPMDRVDFSGMRGRGMKHTITGAFKLFWAFFQALRILRTRKADAVLGMGGYVCLPGGWATAFKRLPLVLVNADASLLLSNRALLRLADRVAFGFPGKAAQGTAKGVVTGNPVRAEIESMPSPAQRYAGRQGPLQVLVVGGSLGARVLNDTVPAALALMLAAQRPQVRHQTGTAHFEAVKANYAKAGVSAEVLPFIDRMSEALTQCDVIVCRAGAVTVSELCAGGVASVLVPLIVSTTSHQRDNAATLAQAGAAIHLPQTELTPQALAQLLQGLTRDSLQAMAERARQQALPQAAARVADEIERLVRHQRQGARP
jgi:UDP-N-acetylglucosamine--N-acetylmuramyl-(pentapeptide) pyrophosphoryl-undecaprenol N-acetylglucosamine transferase